MFNIHFSIERWKFNKEYNVYVSNQGRFRDKDKKEIFPAPCQGYLIFRLGSIWIPAHRLVLKTWMPVADETLTVDHINHNKRDNSLKNLRWLSKKENEHDEALETFIEGVKEIGAFEYIHGLRGTPDLSQNRRKNIYKSHGLNKDGSVKTKKKKNKKKGSSSVPVDIEDNGVLFTVTTGGNTAENLRLGQAAQFISAYCGQDAPQIKSSLKDCCNSQVKKKKKYGADITFIYKEAI